MFDRDRRSFREIDGAACGRGGNSQFLRPRNNSYDDNNRCQHGEVRNFNDPPNFKESNFEPWANFNHFDIDNNLHRRGNHSPQQCQNDNRPFGHVGNRDVRIQTPFRIDGSVDNGRPNRECWSNKERGHYFDEWRRKVEFAGRREPYFVGLSPHQPDHLMHDLQNNGANIRNLLRKRPFPSESSQPNMGRNNLRGSPPSKDWFNHPQDGGSFSSQSPPPSLINRQYVESAHRQSDSHGQVTANQISPHKQSLLNLNLIGQNEREFQLHVNSIKHNNNIFGTALTNQIPPLIEGLSNRNEGTDHRSRTIQPLGTYPGKTNRLENSVSGLLPLPSSAGKRPIALRLGYETKTANHQRGFRSGYKLQQQQKFREKPWQTRINNNNRAQKWKPKPLMNNYRNKPSSTSATTHSTEQNESNKQLQDKSSKPDSSNLPFGGEQKDGHHGTEEMDAVDSSKLNDADADYEIKLRVDSDDDHGDDFGGGSLKNALRDKYGKESDSVTTKDGKNDAKEMKADGNDVKDLQNNKNLTNSDTITKPVGQEYISPVTGYFCRLCNKFYNKESMAKIDHCQSDTHKAKYREVTLKNEFL